MSGKMTKNECAAMQESLVLLACGELSDEQRHRLESHVRSCENCAAEMANVNALHHLMSAKQAEELSASLLASSRMQLDEALDHLPKPGGVSIFRQMLRGWAFHVRAVPALASLLLVLGFAGGSFAGLEVAKHSRSTANADEASANLTNASIAPNALPEGIANISAVSTQPGSNLVQVRYNRLVPGTMQGQPSDPRIQQLLLLATQNRVNPGVRVDSVGLLADGCREGRDCSDTRVRQALMTSLRYDKNPGVRLKALDGLASYVAQDQAVRDSVLEALLHDENSGVRTQAIQLLSPVEADGSVREVLHTLANDDRNPYIRTVSQETLQQGPEIQ